MENNSDDKQYAFGSSFHFRAHELKPPLYPEASAAAFTEMSPVAFNDAQ
jgi:hypothetical protein